MGASLTTLSACSIAKGYSDSEQEMVNTMTPSKYQPATRDMRSSIETQDLLSQAAFWSREYQLNPADLEAAVKLASSVRKMGARISNELLYGVSALVSWYFVGGVVEVSRAHTPKPASVTPALSGKPNFW